MKRFLADCVLILLLVGIGSQLMEGSAQPKTVIQYRIDEFEKSVEEQHIIQNTASSPRLNPLNENKASRLARLTSEKIVAVVDTTVEIVSSLFLAIIE